MEIIMVIDFCKDFNICQNGVMCKIDIDKVFDCECKGYFYGINCEILLGKLYLSYKYFGSFLV